MLVPRQLVGGDDIVWQLRTNSTHIGILSKLEISDKIYVTASGGRLLEQ
jgi:uncharacterized protein YijF (DUF1287 family)